ncbi:MAG: endonuclease/exonuclease/phosphatase family protein [Rhodobacteraceae bacterium]|nr:endonuclease/exonuclease/phosphatase family protein [Paracoccaceae bacterium]
MPLRVASYNIRKAVGRDFRRDPLRVLKVMANLSADVIALQEVDRRFGSKAASISRQLLFDSSPLTLVEFSSRPQSIGWHGNAILLRNGMKVLDRNRLTLPGLEPRGAIMVDLVNGAGSLRVVGLHLGLFKRDRKKQLAEITGFLDALTPMPTIIMGDFNEWSRRGRNLTALQQGFDVHSPGHSFPSSKPVAKLDKIAISPGLSVMDAGVHQCKAAKMASDHLPVWADIATG